MASVIRLQKLRVHNWGMVNLFVWYIISAVSHCLAIVETRGEEGACTKEFVAVGMVCSLCRWLH